MSSTVSMHGGYAYGQLGLNPITTSREVIPSYVIRIPPGAALERLGAGYYPDSIAIPSRITVAWFNEDPGESHTVTSGTPNSPESGKMFNSGIIPYTSFFQHTFDNQVGNKEIVYYCELHPWRTGKIYVNRGFEQGNNFILASGTGPTLNVTQHDRTLLDFKPFSLTTESTTPILYNIAVLGKNNSGDTITIFSRTFSVLGTDDLKLELIPRPELNATTVYGPDFTYPVTGAYHIEGDFMKPGNNYTLRAEIKSTGTEIPSEKIADDFNISVVS